ncbi:MAG TPA: hypothetical protein VGS00_07930 [Thermoanaerobaculia bacterium]|nr:hypothetical protein [Thermoanaerobaculia bacterium]
MPPGIGAGAGGEEQAPLRCGRVHRSGEVEVAREGRSVRVKVASRLGRPDRGEERGIEFLAVAGEVLPQLQVRVVGDDRHTVGRQELVEESLRLERHSKQPDDPAAVVVGLEEEDDEPARGRARPVRLRRLGRARETWHFRHVGRNPFGELERHGLAVHLDEEVRGLEVRDRLAPAIHDVSVHHHALDARLLAVAVRTARRNLRARGCRREER